MQSRDYSLEEKLANIKNALSSLSAGFKDTPKKPPSKPSVLENKAIFEEAEREERIQQRREPLGSIQSELDHSKQDLNLLQEQYNEYLRKNKHNSSILKVQDENSHFKYLETENASMRAELKELREGYSRYENESIQLKKDKIGLLKTIEDLKRDLHVKEGEFEMLLREKIALQDKLMDGRQFASRRHSEITASAPNEEVKHKSPRRRNEHRRYRSSRSSNKENASKSPISNSKIKLTLATASKIIRSVMKELNIQSPHMVLNAVKNLNKQQRVLEEQRQLVDFTSDAVSNYFNLKSPSLRKVGEKVAHLIDENRDMKNSAHEFKAPKEILEKLKIALNVSIIEAIPRAVSRYLIENDHMLSILAKVKDMLGLSHHATLTDIERNLHRRM